MPHGQVLEFSGVTKHFGGVTAVSSLTARVEPGAVTGFLGPNGAGKTTSLRILLGLVRASEGRATIGGVEYAQLRDPLRSVGAVLEASSFHPGRTAANHLRVYARAARIPDARVDEVLGLVGLADAAGRKVGGFSLGMRQRLGLAYALLGDPGVLVLDEPANGLDPEGIRWMRGFMRDLAREGRTVLVSSHLLTEVQQTVDAILVIAQGRLVFQGGLEELADPSEHATVVDAPDRASLAAALTAADVPYELLRSGLTVRGADPVHVGAVAAGAGVALSSLQRRGPALEEVFLELVNGERVHASASGAVAAGGAAGAVAGAEGVPDAAVSAPLAGEAPDADVPVADAAAAAPLTGDVPEADVPVADAAAATSADDASNGDAEAREAAAVAADLDAAAGAPPAAWAATSMGAWTVSDDGTIEDARPAPEPEETESPVEPPTTTAAFSVASTGIIDIVPAASDGQDADADSSAPSPAAGDDLSAYPEDADPDVEAIGEIDDELEDALDDRTGRPGEGDPQTDADLAADAFFAAFDDERATEDADDAAADAAPHGVAGDEASVTLDGDDGDAPPPSEDHRGGPHDDHEQHDGGEHR